jgi:integrase
MEALTPQQILKVLRVASESKRNLAMICLAYKHGLRNSEVCNLKLSDIDLKKGEIIIRRLQGGLTTVQPLADLAGQPLLSEKRALKAWLAERPHGSEYLFTTKKGAKVDRTAYWRKFRDVATRAGLPADKCHPHCLRHALGLALVAANLPLSIVKQALGHKSITTTAMYARPTKGQKGKAVNEVLADLF